MSDTHELRRRLTDALRTDADLDAYARDFFPAIRQRFSDGMDRLAKLTLLLTLAEPEALAAALQTYQTPTRPAPRAESPRVSLRRLPTRISKAIGRDGERTQLDHAWAGPTRRRVVAIVAIGGQGKSTLVVSWLLRLAARDYDGARVFAWSFYTQGTGEQHAASADEFLAAALKFFGDPTPDRGNPFDKADRLRDLLRGERSLLILDGLEPLQYGPEAAQAAGEREGTLRDRALAALLTDLAAHSPGLVVVTSRLPLANLQAFADTALQTLPLRPFSDADGAALLKSLGVHGSDGDLVATVRETHGHPLTLSLLGSLIHEACRGDLRRRSELVDLKPGHPQAQQAQQVMAAYDRWFQRGPERTVLRLLGLFDRPAPAGALQALRAEPTVPGLNQALINLSDGAWNQLQSRLRRIGLLEEESPTDPDAIDAHPMVREYFGDVFKQENEAAWREGHERLYRWFSTAVKYQPDTAEEMAPLYAAVVHGCRAGRHQEVLDQLYSQRILRRGEHYSIKKLGAYGADLAALSGFFTTPWAKPVPGLQEGDRAFVLGSAGYFLRALGRLEDAVAPMRAGLEAAQARQDWRQAAIAASNLSELQLGRGHVREALALARQAVELADCSRNKGHRILRRTDWAAVQHHAGQSEEARRLFEEAEAMQQGMGSENRALYSAQGYQYCDLLLDQGATDSVLQRAEASLMLARQYRVLLDIGLDSLSLGRAHAMRAATGNRASASLASQHLNEAVARLREAGDQPYLPLGLRHRAAWFRQTRDYASAARDLDEGLLLAQRSKMRLHECDLLLERARLHQAQGQLPEAREALQLAREIVEKTGYGRRTAEVQRLTTELESAPQRRRQVPRWLAWGLILISLLAGFALAHAQPAAPYDDLIAKARAAALQQRWAECARLYDQALRAFPVDRSRPASEQDDLAEARERCRQRKPAPPRPLPPPLVALGKLSMGVPHLIGRQEEMEQLKDAWDGKRRRQIVAVVAMGGQGKTTLVVNWLLQLKAHEFRGARRVFAWSFYSQGTSDDRAGSSDEFLAVALKFFGDPEPDRGNPFDKAARLRDLVRKERSLLILDGLEPLQYPPSSPEGAGVLRDRAMAQLLADLAAQNPGLVVVTSRLPLANLQAFEGDALQTVPLRAFSDGDGLALLKYLGVHGSDGELVATVREAHGHPLTLSLLGNLLRDAYAGDIHKRAEAIALKPEHTQGLHAQHVMAAYDRWFQRRPERALLRLMGLFDRPAPAAALAALRAEPVVPGLNDALVSLSDGAWTQLLTRLRRVGLLESENATDASGVDAHPLVREYFGEVLKQEDKVAWHEGHARLYRWYAAAPAKQLPDTAEEMAPLYAAVFHGCRAGRHQEVLDEVFRRRIRRGGEHYSTAKLGTYGADLAALAGFFTTPWARPVLGLRERDRAFVLGSAGYALRALGRLEDAVAPTRAGLEARQAQQLWKNASIAASNLSELQLGLGQVREALALARQAMELADRSSDDDWRIVTRTFLAATQHQTGQREEALRLFAEAEAMQRGLQPETPLLYSLQGYRYCELLLDQDAPDGVLQRAEASLALTRQYGWLLSMGLDLLSLGRAHAARAAAGQRTSAPLAFQHLNEAVAWLRESGDQMYLPLGLLHRAAWFRQSRDYASAARDLDEGLLLAQRSKMRLHECDFLLERARLFQAQGRLPDAREALRLAREIVEKTGYRRRTAEVERLTRELAVKK